VESDLYSKHGRVKKLASASFFMALASSSENVGAILMELYLQKS